MKRELKLWFAVVTLLHSTGCKRNPDEKGTETGCLIHLLALLIPSCKRNPDEKGTETDYCPLLLAQPHLRCKRNPDEKGTETTLIIAVRPSQISVAKGIPMKRELKRMSSTLMYAYPP